MVNHSGLSDSHNPPSQCNFHLPRTEDASGDSLPKIMINKPYVLLTHNHEGSACYFMLSLLVLVHLQNISLGSQTDLTPPIFLHFSSFNWKTAKETAGFTKFAYISIESRYWSKYFVGMWNAARSLLCLAICTL